MAGSAQQYLDMYLSEQISEKEWQEILKERADVKQLYIIYVENRSNES